MPPVYLNVDGQILHAAGGVAHSLRQSWMGVNGPHQVLGRGFQLHGGDRLGDQVGGRGPDDVHTQDLLVLGVGDHLDEALVLAHNAGLGVGGEGKLADLDLDAALFGLGLAQADAADLRLAISAVGDFQRVHGLRGLAGNGGHRHDALHHAGMRQLRETHDDVAHGVDAGFTRLHPFIHLNETALHLHARHLFQADVFGVGLAANSDEDLLRFQFLLLAISGKGDGHAGLGFLYLLHLGAGVEVDTALAIGAGQFLGNVLVLHRHHARQHFQDGDLGVKGAVNGGELHAHGARAHNDEGLGNIFDGKNFDVGEDARVGFQAGEHARRGAGGDDNILSLDGFVVAALARHFHAEYAILRRAGEAAVTGDHLHFVLAHEEFQALGVLGDDFVLALLDDRPIDFGGAGKL